MSSPPRYHGDFHTEAQLSETPVEHTVLRENRQYGSAEQIQGIYTQMTADIHDLVDPVTKSWQVSGNQCRPEQKVIRKRRRVRPRRPKKIAQQCTNVTPISHHDAESLDMTSLSENVQKGSGGQHLGVHISNPYNPTWERVWSITRAYRVYGNRNEGSGDQVIGECVESGCVPIPFAGQYMRNVSTDSGRQIIGLKL